MNNFPNHKIALKLMTKMPACNKRFGLTAAGRVDLKGSAGKPPSRCTQAPREYRLEKRV